MSKDLLLEIRTEDLPPSEIDSIKSQLKEKFLEHLRQQELAYSEIHAFYTIRRFGIIIKSLVEKQPDRIVEKRGPSKNVAFDQDGKPTRALEGFLSSNNAKLDEIEIKSVKNGEYVFLKKKIEGLPTKKLLEDSIPKILNSLNFKKPMRWGDGKHKFVRPVKSILCLFGSEVVEFEFLGIRSGNRTVGLRFFSDAIEISSIDEYFDKLRGGFVICDPLERVETIENQMDVFEKSQGVKVDRIEALIDEINKICEYPLLVSGKFKEDFLNLPEEIIETTLNHHQRALTVRKKDGKISNLFIAFQDRPGIEENVKKGYETVVNARLTDAEFYYHEDLKVPLEERNEKLKGMIFQKELGTLYDKVKRIENLSIKISKRLGFSDKELAKIQEAAKLSKADIVTNLVYEFPELQGIAGRIYALKQGKDPEIAYALEDQYLPGGEDNKNLPRNVIGAVIGLADRIDTIVGNFLIGNVPSGSRDPFALRRKLYGVIKIIVAFEWDLPLGELFEYSKDLLKIEKHIFHEEIEKFVKVRLENYLIEEEGIDGDIAKAVLRLWRKPLRAYFSAKALQKHRKEGTLDDILIAFERPFNITKNYGTYDYSGTLFKEEIEKELFQRYIETKEEVEKHLDHLNFYDALEVLRRMKSHIDEYFDNVFVMVNQEEIKLNRLGFLKTLTELFLNFGDLDLIERKERNVQ